MAEYFFVNAKYENMKSERGSREVKGSIWRNTREDWRNTLACSSSMSYRVILGPKENFFRVDNTGYKWLFFEETSFSSGVNETQSPNLNMPWSTSTQFIILTKQSLLLFRSDNSHDHRLIIENRHLFFLHISFSSKTRRENSWTREKEFSQWVFTVSRFRAAGGAENARSAFWLLSLLSALPSVDEKCGGVPRFPARWLNIPSENTIQLKVGRLIRNNSGPQILLPRIFLPLLLHRRSSTGREGVRYYNGTSKCFNVGARARARLINACKFVVDPRR